MRDMKLKTRNSDVLYRVASPIQYCLKLTNTCRVGEVPRIFRRMCLKKQINSKNTLEKVTYIYGRKKIYIVQKKA